MPNQRDLFGLDVSAPEDGSGASRRRRPRAGSPSGVASPAFTPGSAVLTRLVDTSVEIARAPPSAITYQHTVLCQIGMPYRNQGMSRLWERRNGRVHLRIEAGSALHPVQAQFVPLPLPFGPKARLILIHLNGEALRRGSSTIEVEDSLTAFVKRLVGRSPNGREIRLFRDQLGSLSASLVRLAVIEGERALQIDTKVISAFDLWAPRDPHQRVLWPSVVQLGADYFESLTRHAVPLDERAVAALAHSALALDVYAWLAQRLHRVPVGRPQRVPWSVLREQFGPSYGRIRKFREKFLHTLAIVHAQYRGARVMADQRGLKLSHSAPPVPARALPRF